VTFVSFVVETDFPVKNGRTGFISVEWSQAACEFAFPPPGSYFIPVTVEVIISTDCQNKA
jgi:hypothetical protein